MDIQNYIQNIFKLKNEAEFNNLALKLFNYQYENNTIYKQYVKLIHPNILDIKYYMNMVVYI